MNRNARTALASLLLPACLAAGHPAPAAEPDRRPIATVTATVRSVDARRGAVEVECGNGERLELAVDAAGTMIFRGIRLLALDELAVGAKAEIDYRPAAGGETARATWIEVLEPGARGADADGAGHRGG